MCVCDSETEDNWNFFFTHLKKLLEPHERVIAFISDRGHGLLKAFDNIFPDASHLYCYKHLLFNLKNKYSGKGQAVVMKDVLNMFFTVAYSSTEREFYHNLREFKDAGGAVASDFIADMPLQHWCRAFFKGSRYGIMANSSAESFNNWISVERSMPVFAMFDQTQMREMKMMGERKAEAGGWTTHLTPKMDDKLKTEMDKARRFRVVLSDCGVYEVRDDKYSYFVDLNECTCSCVKWRINCFPCMHALSAIQGASASVYDFIKEYFTTDCFRKSYSFPIHPVSNVDSSSSLAGNEIILPPITKRPAGRPRSKRVRSAGETKPIRCGRCHKMGHHNKKCCTEPITY